MPGPLAPIRRTRLPSSLVSRRIFATGPTSLSRSTSGGLCPGFAWASAQPITSIRTQRNCCRRLRTSFSPRRCGSVPALPFSTHLQVAVETCLSGRRALFADVNPLARLITCAKTTPLDAYVLDAALAKIEGAFASLSAQEGDLPWVVNCELWYDGKVIEDLARLRRVLLELELGDLSAFLWATFSVTARKASRSNPRFAVPVRLKSTLALAPPDVWRLFVQQFQSNRQRVLQFSSYLQDRPKVDCVGDDAKALVNAGNPEVRSPLPNSSVDLILTSPPYAGAQKYIRASSLSLGWLGLTGPQTLKQLENASIGREHFKKSDEAQIPEVGIAHADSLVSAIRLVNPTRAAICAFYLVEMRAAVREMVRVMKPSGKAVLVIGDNSVCGLQFPSTRYLTEMFEGAGARSVLKMTDTIKSRGLLTKRSGGAEAIAHETILVFEK